MITIPLPTLPMTRPAYAVDGESIHPYPKVDGVFCPIDGNPLFLIGESDRDKCQYYRWDCLACSASYKVGDTNLESLRNQAIRHLQDVIIPDIQKLRGELAKLEAVLKSAQDKGLVRPR